MSNEPPEFTLDTAWQLARPFIHDQTAATPTELDNAARLAHGFGQQMGSTLSVDEIRRYVESKVVIVQKPPSILNGDQKPTPWLEEARRERGEPLWTRYYDHLDGQGMPTSVLRRLDDTTREILGRLHDPRSPGPWRGCGLVVGEVQSGKTQNFIGLACRAADMGYRLIVVLAGIQNSLRSQTQLRIDDGFTGYDSMVTDRADKPDTPRIGVGLIRPVTAWSFTDSRAGGDFKKAKADSYNLNTDNVPVILVVKKNVKILENLRSWISDHYATTDPATGSRTVTDRPLLIIDDEADQASIDTAKPDPDTDPTRINQEIRLLLKTFNRAAFVGYTATPYANLYADHTADHDKYGPDLFPRDFIVSLRAPSNHFGPVRVFGLAGDDDDAVDPLPVFREVDDAASWLPARHKKDHVPPDPPPSVREAVHSFILAGAIRTVRGQGRQHHSMLVHGTRLQLVQERVYDQIADLVQTLKTATRTEAHRPDAELWQELRGLWEKDHVTTSAAFAAQDPAAVQPEWEAIRAEIPTVVDRIRVKRINGESDDVLDYYENRRTGLYVIAVGGDKLSRGLTLDGLTVSYYLRASNMYDTLLQMGRWFGYRPGYEDLCRLYTTKDLYNHYIEITAATEELRRELESMAALGETPGTYGLGVQQSTNGLLVTSPSKMRHSDVVRLTFAQKGPESTVFDIRPKALTDTARAVETLVTFLIDRGTPTEHPLAGRDISQRILWRKVPPALVVDFLRSYRYDQLSQRVRPDLIARYIEACTQAGELNDLSVMLASVSNDQEPRPVGPLLIQPIRRAALDAGCDPGKRYRIRRVLSPPDEMADLTQSQRDRVKEETEAGKDMGSVIRAARVRGQQALLIIYPIAPEDRLDIADNQLVFGYKLSFPPSDRVVDVPDLRVNRIWGDFSGADDDPPAGDDDDDDSPSAAGTNPASGGGS